MREEIAGLLQFQTLLWDKKITLDEYVEAQETEEKTVYFITGKSRGEVLASPYLEQFRKNNVDVILLTESIDEWLVQALTEYKKAKFVSVTSSDISLNEETEEQKKQKQEQAKTFKDLLELTKNTIGAEKIEKVELNSDLWEALGALKTPEGGLNPQMEKMMKAMGQEVPTQKRILELNPENALVQGMKKEFDADLKSEKLKDLMNFAYYQAVLQEGGELENIGEYVKLTNKIAGSYV